MNYQTVGGNGKGIYKEKMSKFISFAFPVSSADEAKAAIKSLQNEYHDARHVCWAYMLGADRARWQLNDNGEPSGTAGKPILGQINSLELTDVMVAVVRYFGGIKLGTSGLIAAYREAARLALGDATIEERHVMSEIKFTFPYLAMNDVMKLTKIPGIKIVGQEFDNTCTMTVAIRLDDAATLKEKLSDIDGVCLDE